MKSPRQKNNHSPQRTTDPAKKKKKKEEAKFRITDSELAKEMREGWIKSLVSQGEDADYLEKLLNKEIYRAFMGQQGQLANKKRAEEEEKAKQKSKKTIAFNRRSHEERKVMIDFLKARGESGKRLGPMNFMNLQALYIRVKKEEEERLGKTSSKKRVITPADDRKSKIPHPPLPLSNNLPLSLLDLPPLHPKSPNPLTQLLLINNLPRKKSKPTTKPEDSRDIVNWFYSTKDQRFEVFRGRTEERRSIYTSVDEVLQLPDSDLRRMMELGEANEPENEGGRHLLLRILVLLLKNKYAADRPYLLKNKVAADRHMLLKTKVAADRHMLLISKAAADSHLH
ncbi:hypothetical protein L1987_63843 [Smallanthus sonchifolius]|uniref:Uncharacterized protein n=1 Tax=Smallanthus sonchifolius TaxID=185202 RepID=A0ACB9CEE6_9ASTR|nr:hypothetical protein L1987_63843 [Smallanthus sonchifolius]